MSRQQSAIASREAAEGLVTDPVLETRRRTGRLPVVSELVRWSVWTVVSAVAAVVLLESVFAAAHLGEGQFIKLDPLLGFGHLENKLVTYRQEGYSRCAVNSRGFVDRECSLEKPPGVVRIAVLGDSRTEALQVAPQCRFTRLLEQKLTARFGPHFQVLNFGMSGYSTGQELILFLDKVAAYKPDITILGYNISDSDENADTTSPLDFSPRPHFSLDGSGKLVVQWTALKLWFESNKARYYQATDWLRRHSRIWGVLLDAQLALQADKSYKIADSIIRTPFSAAIDAMLSKAPATAWNARWGHSFQAKGPVPTDAFDETWSSNAILATLSDPEGSAGASQYRLMLSAGKSKWQLTAAIIRELSRACRGNGSSLIVMAMPGPNNAIFYDRELKDMVRLSRQEGFQFVNLNKVFPPKGPLEPSPYFIQTHFSRTGHRLVADTLMQRLLTLRRGAVRRART